MTREDFRRELGDAFDSISGSPNPSLPDRVRAALVEDAPERHGQVWIAALAAAVIAVIVVGILLVGNPLNRPPSPGGHGTGTPGSSPAAISIPSPSPSPSPTVAPFTCSETSVINSPLSLPPLALIDRVQAGTHTGYDRLTIEFQNAQPGKIEIRTQTNTTFTRSPRGDTVKLAGRAGILVVIKDADGHAAYNGPKDIKTGFATGLLEASEVEDFEGTVQWALGLGVTPCYRAFILSGPTRLVIDVQTS